MISLNDTHPAPKAVESYRVRREAMDAAVFDLGPHARHGFEYTTLKCDGRWLWKPTDEVPAPTPAEIKANGGKRSLLAMANAITEGTPMADPNRLPVPPRRTLGKAAGASDRSGGTRQPTAPENEPAAPPASVAGIGIAVGDKITYPDSSEGRVICSLTIPACNGLDIEPHDDLSIPDFLKRESTPEAKAQAANAMKRIAKQVGPNRVIKNPPDAKAAAKRAEKTKSALAKVEGTPEHAKAKRAGKALVSAKPAKAKTAAPAKKRTSEAPAKMAGAPTSKAALIKGAIAVGQDDETIVQEVRAAFPGCEYKASDIKWYRRKMEKTKA